MNIEIEQIRAQRMLLLRDHLAELFTLVGVQAESVPVTEQPLLRVLLENVFQDKTLYEFLETLDRNTLMAVQKMKDRNLEQWNFQENEKQMDRQLDEKEDCIRSLEERLRTLETEKAKTQAALSTAEETVEALCKEQLNMIRDMIALRDNLLMRASWIADNDQEDANAAKLVDAQLRDTGRLLTKMGVEIQEDGGLFDNQKHTVVDTVPAPSEELIDHIFKTVRPGYRFRGDTLRFQEVILYTKGG